MPRSVEAGLADLDATLAQVTADAPQTLVVVVGASNAVSYTHLDVYKRQIYVSPACAPCQRTLALTPGWAQQLAPTVSVYVVQRLDGAERAAPGTLADPHGHLAEALELPATPAAVLLGTDGRVDGGPVSGEMRVSSFVADLLPGLPES